MVIQKKDTEKEIKKNMRGGDGEIEITHFVSKDNLKNARLLAKINIPPGASIGEHEHLNETEYFIILKGNGIVNDDGTEKNVGEGDVIITGNGAKHNIRNSGNITLEMIPIIITY